MYDLYIRFMIWLVKMSYGYIQLPVKVVYSQFVLETAGFTSNLFVNYNNISGMRFPAVRQTTAIDDSNGFAVYGSVYDSIQDYFMRMENFGISDTNDYQLYMNDVLLSGYCPDYQYLELWQTIYFQS